MFMYDIVDPDLSNDIYFTTKIFKKSSINSFSVTQTFFVDALSAKEMRIFSSVFTAALAFKSGKNIANGNCDDLSLENEPICTDGCDGALTQCFMMCDPSLVP